jgi:hypothetical protein
VTGALAPRAAGGSGPGFMRLNVFGLARVSQRRLERGFALLGRLHAAVLALDVDERLRVAAMAALMDLAWWPPRAHLLGPWFVRELRCGDVGAWLSSFNDARWEQALGEELALLAVLLGNVAELHEPLPPLGRMRWRELLVWAADRSPDVDARLAQWQERNVLHDFQDGWAVVAVRSPADLALHGRLMHNCVGRSTASLGVRPDEVLVALRDRLGRPHADAYVRGGAIVELEGKCGLPAKSEYVRRVRVFASAHGLGWDGAQSAVQVIPLAGAAQVAEQEQHAEHPEREQRPPTHREQVQPDPRCDAREYERTEDPCSCPQHATGVWHGRAGVAGIVTDQRQLKGARNE